MFVHVFQNSQNIMTTNNTGINVFRCTCPGTIGSLGSAGSRVSRMFTNGPGQLWSGGGTQSTYHIGFSSPGPSAGEENEKASA